MLGAPHQNTFVFIRYKQRYMQLVPGAPCQNTLNFLRNIHTNTQLVLGAPCKSTFTVYRNIQKCISLWQGHIAEIEPTQAHRQTPIQATIEHHPKHDTNWHNLRLFVFHNQLRPKGLSTMFFCRNNIQAWHVKAQKIKIKKCFQYV